MIDLQSFSSNLILIGFALICICCLYLLYSNFVKMREINELNQKYEDLKRIFFNQQKENDVMNSKLLSALENNSLQNTTLTHNNLKIFNNSHENIPSTSPISKKNNENKLFLTIYKILNSIIA